MKYLLPLILLSALAILAAPAAYAEPPAAVCAQHGTDDRLRPVPESLAGTVNEVFGTAIPPAMVAATTVYRCADGLVQLCTTGANLPCGPANTSRTPSPGEVAWCNEYPKSAFIPAAATGHDTIFEWSCQNGAPQITRQILDVDARGFIAQFWKPMP
jgi:hypothetical protein